MASETFYATLQEEHPSLRGTHTPFGAKYAVERVLGRGGMGIVFQARHVRLGQRVAIKVLGPELRQYPELVQRFEREARACGALSSAHAVRVFDIDATKDGTPFIVMEFLAGQDLLAILERDGPQPVPRAVGWIIEACDAIAEAHRLGIVHRDIKPSNLFLTDVDGHTIVKVLDFGIAKRVSTQEVAITHALAPLGTPQYMSPEQVRCAKDIDARTDVWSLGVTLYEMVCGKTPFAHESASACIASIVADPLPDPRLLRPDLPDELAAVLMRALEKNANDRYQSVDELVAAIAPFATTGDEENMVSSVRRAFVLAPRPPPREPAESASFRTVPPAISHVSAPAKWRLKSSLGLAAAAVLGVAALVFVARAGATNIEGAATSQRVATSIAPSAAAAPAPALDVPTAASEPVGTARATRPTQAPSADVALASPATRAATVPSVRAVRARVEKPAPARSSVHGGLSSPGF